jgi:CheY-like chemotaxis protein
MKRLVVEDSSSVRAVIKSIVATLPDDMSECVDGTEALAAYTSSQQDFVLMDMDAEQMDGITATRLIRAADPSARVIMITSYDLTDLREARAGASGYVLKEKLLELVPFRGGLPHNHRRPQMAERKIGIQLKRSSYMRQRIRSAMCRWTLTRLGLSGLGVLVMVLALSPGATVPQSRAAGGSGRPPEEWITINKDYSSQRYVDLDQITPKNVSALKEVCEIRLNEPVWFTSGLLKVGRTLYVTTLRATYAFDAVNCQLRWRKPIDFKQTIATNNQRGAAYLDGRIFRGTADGRVIGLDAETGEPLKGWDVQAADPTIHEGFSAAPIAWEGKVFLGIVVGDFGIAGRLMAFDAQTAEKLWSFETTMGKHAGGAFWTTYSLDPRTGELFAGVANPAPDYNRDFDQDNSTAFTDSLISVNVINSPQAKLSWYYQAVPHDEHDWDLATAPTLYRTPAGKDMVAIAGKSGRVYGIDRATHALVFDTPGTTTLHDDEPLDKTWKLVCPGLQGGAMFNGTAYHPGTDTLYVGMSDHCAFYTKNIAFGPSGGATAKQWSAAAKLKAPRGWITAMDGET